MDREATANADPELLFGGTPAVPVPAVFEEVRRKNPPWYTAVSDAYAEFARRPENAGVYHDPTSGNGATIAQIACFWELIGQQPVCVLARPLPALHTRDVPRLEQLNSQDLLSALKYLSAQDGELNVPTLHHDGATGHCIRLTNYDSGTDSFEYHDPWPVGTLLSEENNLRGVRAKPHGKRWRVTTDELARVLIGCFVFPWDWRRARNEPSFSLSEAEFRSSKFFSFFHLSLLGEQSDPPVVRRAYAPTKFAEVLHLETDARPNGRISAARLIVDYEWMAANFTLAVDLSKSTILAIAPPDDAYRQLAEALWSLVRDPAAANALRVADPSTSEVVACVHAFVGSVARAAISTENGSIQIGTLEDNGVLQRGIEIRIL